MGHPIRESGPQDVARNLDIWREAVLATHDFLEPGDFEEIARVVEEDYLPHAEFWVAVDEADRPLGFMGLREGHIDSLFVDPAVHGRGVGKALVHHAVALAGAVTVDVNEQNPRGVGFYEKLGFVRRGWSAVDPTGRPYPIVHMIWAG